MNTIDKIPVCPHGDKGNMEIFLVAFCDWLCKVASFDIVFSSGYRCPECNERAGGAKNSAHLRGKAVDVLYGSDAELYQIVTLSVAKGILRVGIDMDHIHLDVDPSLPQRVMWLESR